MPVRNNEIADIFEQYADLLEIDQANRFRVRAYRNAARAIRSNPQSMAELLKQGQDLAELPAIGDDLAAKIATIVATGKLPQLDKEASHTPVALSQLMQIQGLGPKRISTLHRKLNVDTLADLERAVRSGAIVSLKGFGPKIAQRIAEQLETVTTTEKRWPLRDAEDIASSLLAYLQQHPDVEAVEVAGSLRRRRETVGDLDIVICAQDAEGIMDHFVNFDEVSSIISKGSTRASVQLRCGISVDLRVVPGASYGATLQYFTGSKAHSIALRKLALNKGLKLNEYGIFKGDKRLAGSTEAEIYDSLALPWIPPELRENRGELEAAAKGDLPKLVRLDEIRGDLHCHSSASDGTNTLQTLANAAAKLGYQYLSINDHSQHVSVAHGLDKGRLLQQIRAIDKLNAGLDGLVILKSTEVDILEDGTLDLPDSVLRQLDFTVCAIHYQFNLSERKQTERILRAMDNPYFNILAHPSGRLINRRVGYHINLEAVMRAAVEKGCFLEVNAHPERLDLNDEGCRLARELGLKVAISTDAHSLADLGYMHFGVDQARRGWLEKADVLNTRPLPELLKLFNRKTN